MKEKDSNTPVSSAFRPVPGFRGLFSAVLRRERRRALAAACSLWGTVFILAFGLYILTDVYFPLENETRMWASVLLVFLLLVLLAVFLVHAWRGNPAALARRADAANHDSRQTVLSCWEMSCQPSAESHAEEMPSRPLKMWLMRETERAACSWLEQYMQNDRLRFLLKRKSIWSLFLLLAVCLVLTSWNRDAAGTLYGRLCTPWKDVPPLSPYRFELVDSPSSIVYGEDALMQVRVTGAPLAAPVEIWVRPDGYSVQKLAAFRDQSGIWGRRLEKLTSPCRIAFATGKARSEWYPLDINYQPKVTAGSVIVSPPEYTGLPPIEYPLNGQDVTVVDGGTVDFVLASNRSLMSGKAVFTPDRKDMDPQTVQGVLLPDGRISFPFRVRQSGTASIQITDYRGTEMARPLENRIRVNADARPSVVIHAPGPVSVALENAVIPFHAEVQDDYGVTRVAWIRSVNGSRARSLEMPVPEASRKSLFLVEQLPLPALGARAGDTLQLSVEARDANPYLLNVTVSEPVTVHVIHEEQYREMLRLRTSVDEFVNKYRLLSRAIDDLVRELDRARADNPDGLSREEAARLKKTHAGVRKLAEKMAKDFPIFDTDGKLSETASLLAGIIAENEKDLSGELPGTPDSVREFFRILRDRLRAPREDMKRQAGEAEMVEKAMRVYGLIMEFRRLADSQREPAAMMDRFLLERNNGRSVTAEQLKSLGESQKEILAQYWLWHSRVPAVISVIPEEAGEFRREMEAFIQACLQMGIAEFMEESASACAAGRPAEAAGWAQKAWETMMKLLGKNSAASEKVCSVNCMSRECAGAMQQLLNSMLNRNQGVGGLGSGRGEGGDGFLNDAPMFGPQREKFPQFRPSETGAGEGSRKGENRDGSAESSRPSSAGRKKEKAGRKQEQTTENGLDSPAMRHVPGFYRDAVRQYFEQHR